MAQNVEMNSPAAVAARMMGSDAPVPIGETNPTSTMPSATDPTTKVGSPSINGSPARGPVTSGVVSAWTSCCALSYCAASIELCCAGTTGPRCVAVAPTGLCCAELEPGSTPIAAPSLDECGSHATSWTMTQTYAAAGASLLSN